MYHDETLIHGRADIGRVIEMLDRAEGPDRTLDAYIHGVLEDREVYHTPEGETLAKSRRAPYDTCVYLKNGLSPGAGGLLQVPRYTSSLDAALPLEDITSVDVDTPNRVRWRAFSATGMPGFGPTEAIARRAAALEAMRHAAKAA